MGQQIIKQPNGKYAIFSSFTDTIIVWNAEREYIIEHYVNKATLQARKSVTETLDDIDRGRPDHVYMQFAMTWEEALASDKENGGLVWVDREV